MRKRETLLVLKHTDIIEIRHKCSSARNIIDRSFDCGINCRSLANLESLLWEIPSKICPIMSYFHHPMGIRELINENGSHCAASNDGCRSYWQLISAITRHWSGHQRASKWCSTLYTNRDVFISPHEYFLWKSHQILFLGTRGGRTNHFNRPKTGVIINWTMAL